ncbi:MAG: nucleotidyl transferase AbiEii/AbiGii toxin family protein [Sphaerochaeta sp.]
MAARATELNFIRDTLEKVFRLTEILSYINENPIMKNCLALKGGTAINLTVFDLPRLSVDIDLDYVQQKIELRCLQCVKLFRKI